jgi:predicted dithiol-disulfide oxidoreductase (DUF899 family)
MYQLKGQSDEYVRLREELLKAELALAEQRERVAQLRRQLPCDAPIYEDYVFHEGPADLSKNSDSDFFETQLSELFEDGKNSLIVDHLMYAPNDENACPMCTMWADGYDAIAPHVKVRCNFVLVARAPIGKLRAWGRGRGWNNLRLLSSFENTFNRDYKVETSDEIQHPALSVFVRDHDGKYFHYYTIQAHFDEDHMRGIDLYSPVWNLFDLLPEGRGDWMPRYSYE